jgi:hypothetical protein
MSKRPKPFAAKQPTDRLSWICESRSSPVRIGIVSPGKTAPLKPPRAAFSHSSSLGKATRQPRSRTSLAIGLPATPAVVSISLSQSHQASASCQLTRRTGRLSGSARASGRRSQSRRLDEGPELRDGHRITGDVELRRRRERVVDLVVVNLPNR